MGNFAVVVATASVSIVISLLLKICNVLHLNKERKRRKADLSGFDLLREDVSYEKYKKIAKRTSVPNNPIRTSGDFIDFILDSDGTMENMAQLIENNLFNLNCGVFFDE